MKKKRTSFFNFSSTKGHSKPFKTVSCKAIEDSLVLKLPAAAFLGVFKEYPECMVRIIQVNRTSNERRRNVFFCLFNLQILMIRLQRVTFLALHDYLGLTTELTRPSDIIPSLPSRERPQENSKLHRSETGPSSKRMSVDENSNEKETFQPVRSSQSVLDLSFTSPTTDTPPTDPKLIETPVTNDERISVEISTGRKRSGNFSGQRSMSVVESNRIIPDFEEAAARARVKNSLDTNFFKKYRISYPNVPNHRSTHRQISFPDVRKTTFDFLRFYDRSIRFV